MNFLQPWILATLPLMALPLLIHLINQYRHRSVPWAAMMFLINAKRMNKGMARLRYVLIMLMRMAAIGAMIFAFSRPMAGGWMSGIGIGKPDVTLILLDRSASMEARDIQTGESKRTTALTKLTDLLVTRGYGDELVLIDSANEDVQLIESPQALHAIPNTGATATSANIPGMVEKALSYLNDTETGRADIWICSDLRENDWKITSGRWKTLQEQVVQKKGIQFYLLSYTDSPSNNLSIRIENVKRVHQGSQSELIMDIHIEKGNTPTQINEEVRQITVEFEVNHVRSVLELDMDSQGAVLQGHRIPIENSLHSGWGKVSLPNDSNPLDNEFYFVFSEPPLRKSTIVADDESIGKTFQLGLAIPADSDSQHTTEILTPSRVHEIDWENTGVLIWQTVLPSGFVAEQIKQFINSGRVVLFFPPSKERNRNQLFDSGWGNWQQLAQEQTKISWWRGTSDLLANAGSGNAIPVNDLRVYQYRSLETASASGKGISLAKLNNNHPLFIRKATERGGVYFCSTLPTAHYSSLERDGIVFYIMLQRALAVGSQSLSSAVQQDAGANGLVALQEFDSVAPRKNSPTLSQRGLHAGVYQQEGFWTAINRSLVEDDAAIVSSKRIDALFEGIAYQRIEDAVGDTSSLASEIWELFLLAMIAALIFEAWLCMPEKRIDQDQNSGFTADRSRVKKEAY